MLLLAGAALLLNIVLWAGVLLTFPKNAPAAVLHYTVGVGVDFIGESGQIMVLPIAGTVLLVLNVLFAYILRGASAAAVWMLVGTSALVQLIFLVAYIYLLTLNK